TPCEYPLEYRYPAAGSAVAIRVRESSFLDGNLYVMRGCSSLSRRRPPSRTMPRAGCSRASRSGSFTNLRIGSVVITYWSTWRVISTFHAPSPDLLVAPKTLCFPDLEKSHREESLLPSIQLSPVPNFGRVRIFENTISSCAELNHGTTRSSVSS